MNPLSKTICRFVIISLLSVSSIVVVNEMFLLPVQAAPAEQNNPTWDDQFIRPPKFSGRVYAAGETDDGLYIVGDFDSKDEFEVDNIARWDGRTWHTVGSGVNGRIRDVATNGSNIYIVGSFSLAGSVPVGQIAHWDGTDWSAVGTGTGVGGFFRDVNAVLWHDDNLYVGGRFESIDGVAAAGLAVWDGTSWGEVGGGVDGQIHALSMHEGKLYVGGDFDKVGGISSDSIAVWDGTKWTSLSDDIGNAGRDAIVHAIAASGTDVYIGGQFKTAGGKGANSIARWDGAGWNMVGAGALEADGDLGVVKTLRFIGSTLYAGGLFDTMDGMAVENIVAYADGTWSALPNGGTGDTVEALIPARAGGLYAVGTFSRAGDKFAYTVAHHDESAWHALGNGVADDKGSLVFSGDVNALVSDASGRVFVAGHFNHAGGVPADNLAMWDGNRWQSMGNVDGEVLTLATDGTEIYAGGEFDTAGGVLASNIAKYNPTTKTWSAMGKGTNGKVYDLVVHDGIVYAGGRFSEVDEQDIVNVAWWDGTAWHPFGNQRLDFAYTLFPPRVVKALAVTGDTVYVGGEFDNVFLDGERITVNSILAWDRAADKWSQLGEGIVRFGDTGDVGGDVRDIALHNGKLYVAGDFDKVDTKPVANVVFWDIDTNSWSDMQGGIGTTSNGVVRAIQLHGMNLYATGSFETAGGTPVNNIAIWSDASEKWAALDEGLQKADPQIFGGGYALEIIDDALYVGGTFQRAGPHLSSSFGRWAPLPSTNTSDNRAPQAIDQTITVAPDTPTSIMLSGVDADGDALTYRVVSSPANGVLSGTAPLLTYTPDAGYLGSDSFGFVVNDGLADSDAGTINITVIDAPPAAIYFPLILADTN